MDSEEVTYDYRWGEVRAPDRDEDTVSLVIFQRGGSRLVPLQVDQETVLGRVPPADVLIVDGSISRRHACFTLLPNGTIRVQDLNSTNGIWVEGKRLTEATIEPSTLVRVGDVAVGTHRLSGVESPLHRLASHDEFHRVLEQELVQARAGNWPFSVLNVKGVDQRGHVANWIHAIRKGLRPIDRLAIYSDDTLEIFLPRCGREEALARARDIIESPGKGHRLICSVAWYPSAGATVESLLDAARSALLQASLEEPIRVAGGIELSWEDRERPRGLVVNSPGMKQVLQTVDKLAKTDFPVVITGETGTGKEVIAKLIHERSGRDKMCSINCAAIPEQLVESVLFGHVRGAFTGAVGDSKGVFEEADGGTVLLDEICELSLPTQAKLLRTLETKTILRVGSAKEKRVDVRIIGATNRDLEQMCQKGTFRQDLFFRINTVSLHLPPLRERPDEIPLFVEYFIREANLANNCQVKEADGNALRLLCSYCWPGNVRELRNVVERAVVVAQHNVVTPDDLPDKVVRQQRPEPNSTPSESVAMATHFPSAKGWSDDATLNFKDRLQRFERGLISQALELAGWNQREAARRLRMPLRTLVRKIKDYDLRRPSKRPEEG